MIAKADLADVLHGEMNKNASVFIQEIGDDGNTIVSSEAQSTIVNMIKQTKVQGWEQWKISISITNTEQYRVYMGLQLPLGEYNKLQELIKAEAKKHINRDIVKNNAKTAIDELTAVATE